MNFDPAKRFRAFWASFWALPCLYVAASTALFATALQLDRGGLSARLSASDWPFSVSGDTALETISTLTGVIVALLALFFSITLIVLTMASSNLGVRLIDRWVADKSIRVTLSLLLGLLVYAFLLQGAVDPAGPDDRLPRFSLILLIFALVPTILWLARAFDHLSRRIHVDTSIAELGKDVRRHLKRLAGLSIARAAPLDWENATTIPSRDSGYVDGVQLRSMVNFAERHDLKIRLRRAQGDYVHEGDVLFDVIGYADGDRLRRCVDISDYRTDAAGGMFEAALLAEIAARALSPAVNDVYTALACIDRLGGGLADAFAEQASEGWFGRAEDGPRLLVPHLTPRGILTRPLDIMRQAAAPYPSASIRLLQMLERLIENADNPDDCEWLVRQAKIVAEGAISEAIVEADRKDIGDALRTAIAARKV